MPERLRAVEKIDRLKIDRRPPQLKSPSRRFRFPPANWAKPAASTAKCLRITADKNPSELTGPMVGAEAKKFAKKIGLPLKQPKAAKSAEPAKPTPVELAKREMENLRSALERLPLPKRFNQLLLGIGILIDQNPNKDVIGVTATEVEPANEPESMEDIRQSA